MTNTETDQAWIDELTLALRLRNVRGDAIGDAIAVVRGHLADSGEHAREAFGDPRSYATQFGLPTAPAVRPTDPVVMGPAVSLPGLLVFVSAVSALFDGVAFDISLPQLLLYLVPLAVVLALPWYFDVAVRHLWVFAVAFSLAVLAATGSAFLAPERGHAALVSWPPGWVALVSGAVLLAASAWAVLDALQSGSDAITEPSGQGHRPAGRGHWLAAVTPHLLMPLAALLCVAAEWILA
ncbi:hypothetical protein [Arthrobacter sp. JSM 101049]|uniref:hypothetical protein n=1 Tax=Arthrobacter sp. JSM 101049 TaxID=929097 RepID=UPI00356AF785